MSSATTKAPKAFFSLEMRTEPTHAASVRFHPVEDKENLPPTGSKTLIAGAVGAKRLGGLVERRDPLSDITPPKAKSRVRRHRAPEASEAAAAAGAAGAGAGLTAPMADASAGARAAAPESSATTPGKDETSFRKPPRVGEKLHNMSAKENGVMFNGWAARSFSIR